MDFFKKGKGDQTEGKKKKKKKKKKVTNDSS